MELNDRPVYQSRRREHRHCRHHLLHQHLQSRTCLMGAGLIAKNAVATGTQGAAFRQNLAGAGLQGR